MTSTLQQPAPTSFVRSQPVDLQHLQTLVLQLQQQVQHHDGLFKHIESLQEKIFSLEEKNKTLTAENERLLSLVNSQVPAPASQASVNTVGSSASSWAAAAAKPAVSSPASSSVSAAPAKKARAPSTKKRAAAARAFLSPGAKGPQGFKYVYLGRSRKINRSEVRSRLRRIGVDTGRVLDISFPASGVLGVLMHVQYVEQFTAVMQKAGAELISDFDPLDPVHLADPKFASLSADQRADQLHELVHSRALDTLSFLRPLVVGSVARSFLEWGWIDESDLHAAVSEASARHQAANPNSKSFAFSKNASDDCSSVMSL